MSGISSSINGFSATIMDPRLQAFKSPDFDRVFGAVASLAGAADEERVDVPEIEAEASDALAAIARQARAQNRTRPRAFFSLKARPARGRRIRF